LAKDHSDPHPCAATVRSPHRRSQEELRRCITDVLLDGRLAAQRTRRARGHPAWTREALPLCKGARRWLEAVISNGHSLQASQRRNSRSCFALSARQLLLPILVIRVTLTATATARLRRHHRWLRPDLRGHTPIAARRHSLLQGRRTNSRRCPESGSARK